MVPQAAAYHVAAEGNHVGRTHSLHRITPRTALDPPRPRITKLLRCLQPTGETQASGEDKLCMSWRSSTASHLTAGGQMCSMAHPNTPHIMAVFQRVLLRFHLGETRLWAR